VQAHGVEQVGEQQPVDDEAGHVRDLDRGLAERLAQRVRALPGLGRGRARERELDERHLRHRVEDVQRREAVGAAAGRRELLHGEGARRRREEGVLREQGIKAPVERRLGRGVLDDRLDDDGRLAQAVQVAGHLDVGRARLAALGEAALRALRRPVRARPQHDLAVVRGDRGQPAGDPAAARDADALLRPAVRACHSLLVSRCGPVG
jgi:hypothetical protein